MTAHPDTTLERKIRFTTVHLVHGRRERFEFQYAMANSRCSDCNSVMTKSELNCWVCGEPVAGARRSSFVAWLLGRKVTGKSPVPNVAARAAYFSPTKTK